MNVWQEYTLGSLLLPSRFIRTAAGEGMCDDEGGVTARIIEYYRRISLGGVLGAIITGHSFVSLEGRMRPGQMGISDNFHIPGLRRIAQAIRTTGTRAMIQLSHGGIMCPTAPAGPSHCADHPTARVMSHDEIQKVVHQFAHAADRACEAGFDGVEIHAAHGYLLSQFLSPFYNHRNDEYGGCPENRVRILREIIAAIRRVCGKHFTVGVKINSIELIPGGITLEQAVRQLLELRQEKPDFVEVSGGICTHPSPICSPMQRILGEHCYFGDNARIIKKNTNIPVLMVGGIRTKETAENIIENGWADLVGLCRPLVCEPDLVLRWKQGEKKNSVCRSCNCCVAASRTISGLHCVIKKQEQNTFFG